MTVCIALTGSDASPILSSYETERRSGDGQEGVLLLLRKCRSAKQVKQAHARIIRSGSGTERMVLTKMLQLYTSSYGSMRYATLVFDQIPNPEAFMWNIMIRGHTRHSSPSDALHLYNLMAATGIWPDKFTFTFVGKACVLLGAVHKGKEIHAHAIKTGLDANTFVQNTLLSLYLEAGDAESAHQTFVNMSHRTIVSWTTMVSGLVKRGDLKTARVLFERMPDKNVVSWSTMINGYARSRKPHQALDLFHQMQLANVKPNEFTLVSLLLACAELGSLSLGSRVHDYIQKHGYELTIFLGTALLDMYSKCGSINDAVQVFQKMPERSFATWNAMITSLGVHGRGKEAIRVFSQMEKEKVVPDAVTFIGVLCACLNAGLVEEGCRYLHRMVQEYNIRPTMEHYGYVVDLLSRAGRLAEAHELVANMPIEPDASLCKSLLNAGRTHGSKIRLGGEVSRGVADGDSELEEQQMKMELGVG